MAVSQLHLDGFNGFLVPPLGVLAHALQHNNTRRVQHVPVHVGPVLQQLRTEVREASSSYGLRQAAVQRRQFWKLVPLAPACLLQTT